MAVSSGEAPPQQGPGGWGRRCTQGRPGPLSLCLPHRATASDRMRRLAPPLDTNPTLAPTPPCYAGPLVTATPATHRHAWDTLPCPFPPRGAGRPCTPPLPPPASRRPPPHPLLPNPSPPPCAAHLQGLVHDVHGRAAVLGGVGLPLQLLRLRRKVRPLQQQLVRQPGPVLLGRLELPAKPTQAHRQADKHARAHTEHGGGGRIGEAVRRSPGWAGG